MRYCGRRDASYRSYAGKVVAEAQKEAYISIYRSKAGFVPVDYIDIDACNQPDTPAVDRAYFNRAMKLINEANIQKRKN